MSCALFFVPSVTVVRDCVSPRVKSADPCGRGSTPVSTVIGRISSVFLPSRRRPSLRIISRISRASIFLTIPLTTLSILIAEYVSGSAATTAAAASVASFFTSPRKALRSSFDELMRICLRIRSAIAVSTAVTISAGGAVETTSLFVGFTSAASSSCSALISRIHVWANSIAATKSASDISLLAPSTITIEVSEPATIISRSDASICENVGSTTNSPSTRQTRTSETGPLNGMSLVISAADAPITASMSGSFSRSYE